MEDIVMKLYQFILFLVGVIKDLVLNVSGRAETPETPETTTTA